MLDGLGVSFAPTLDNALDGALDEAASKGCPNGDKKTGALGAEPAEEERQQEGANAHDDHGAHCE